MPRFDEYFKGKSRILVVVPDNTRPCPLPNILPLIVNRLQRAGAQSITVITANGTHTAMPDDALRRHIGASIFDFCQVIQHDAHDALVSDVGTTRRGTRVLMNPLVMEADGLLVISPVQHHYFAGMGGGPKMLVPGLTAAKTALENHRLAVGENGRMNPDCREGILRGNPVAEDIYEAMSFCPPAFYLGIILDEDAHVVEALCGEICAVHQALSRKYHATHVMTVNGQRPLVIASAGGMPRDCNLIQAHKGLHRTARLLVPGGTLVYLAECRDGIGSTTLLSWLEYPTSNEIARHLLKDYTLHGHTALALKEKAEKARIFFVSTLPDEVVSRLTMNKLSLENGNELNINDLVKGLTPHLGWVLPRSGDFLPLPPDEMRDEDR
jgi:nickel-dependent lactate racemase